MVWAVPKMVAPVRGYSRCRSASVGARRSEPTSRINVGAHTLAKHDRQRSAIEQRIAILCQPDCETLHRFHNRLCLFPSAQEHSFVGHVWFFQTMERAMPKDKVKGSAKRDDKTSGKTAGGKEMQAGGTAGGLDKETKKGLGKTEDKIRDKLKG